MSESVADALQTLETQAQATPTRLQAVAAGGQLLETQVTALSQTWTTRTGQAADLVAALHQAGITFAGDLVQQQATLATALTGVQSNMDTLKGRAASATQALQTALTTLQTQQQSFLNAQSSAQSQLQDNMAQEKSIFNTRVVALEAAGAKLQGTSTMAVTQLETAIQNGNGAGQALQSGTQELIASLQATRTQLAAAAGDTATAAKKSADTASKAIQGLVQTPLTDQVTQRSGDFLTGVQQLLVGLTSAVSEYQTQGLAPLLTELNRANEGLSALYTTFQGFMTQIPGEQNTLQNDTNRMVGLLNSIKAYRIQQQNILQKIGSGVVAVFTGVANVFGNIAQSPIFQIATAVAFAIPGLQVVAIGMTLATAVTNVARAQTWQQALVGGLTPLASIATAGLVNGAMTIGIGTALTQGITALAPALAGAAGAIANFAVQEGAKVVVGEAVQGADALAGQQVNFAAPLTSVPLDALGSVASNVVGGVVADVFGGGGGGGETSAAPATGGGGGGGGGPVQAPDFTPVDPTPAQDAPVLAAPQLDPSDSTNPVPVSDPSVAGDSSGSTSDASMAGDEYIKAKNFIQGAGKYLLDYFTTDDEVAAATAEYNRFRTLLSAPLEADLALPKTFSPGWLKVTPSSGALKTLQTLMPDLQPVIARMGISSFYTAGSASADTLATAIVAEGAEMGVSLSATDILVALAAILL